MGFDSFMQEIVNKDLEEIEQALSQHDHAKNYRLHQELDGHYQACINHWYDGLIYVNHNGGGFYYQKLKNSSYYVVDNLMLMKAKIEAFKYQVNCTPLPDKEDGQINITTNVNLGVSFSETQEQIMNMSALSSAEAEEINEKIKELEIISNEEIPKRKKWEQVRKIIEFALNKGVDVALAILKLVAQMNFSA